MNAAQRLLLSIGGFGPLCNFRDYRLINIGGTPPKKRWGKVRDRDLYRQIAITPERALKYMHAHARRRGAAARIIAGIKAIGDT